MICDNLESQGSGEVVLIDPEGQVYDVTQANTLIEGAIVACIQQQPVAVAEEEESVFTLWDAATYGQINPQVTAADGYFSFLTPAGIYRLEVSRGGYQPYTTPDLIVVAGSARYDVGLTPVIDEPAGHIVSIGPAGFSPAYLEVQPGDIIEWINTDLDEHSSTLFRAEVQAADEVVWDSGLLAPGESYKFRVVAENTYSYVDRMDTGNTGVVVVQETATPIDQDEDEQEDQNTFLPSVSNN